MSESATVPTGRSLTLATGAVGAENTSSRTP
jgi:hypothetical protein